MKHFTGFLFLVFFLIKFASAQTQNDLPLNRFLVQQHEASFDSLGKSHSSVKPFKIKDLSQNKLKGIDPPQGWFYTKYLGRKLFSDHFLEKKGEDYTLQLDPLFNFSGGSDFENNQTIWQNSRGLRLQGDIGKKVSFESLFYENQAVYLNYLDSFIHQNNVAPGRGRVRKFGSDGWDYAWATGYVSYSPSKFFNFQLGHGKNFIGDGYRSLLLSDNASATPFFKITTDVGPIKYINIFTEFQDFRTSNLAVDSIYTKKKASIHYLDWAIGKRFNLGIFEAVVWRNSDSTGFRGFDINYWNPVIFLRPVEFSIGSPDNVLIGLNLKYKITNQFSIYGQIILDELKIKEFLSDAGWWGNKHGFQIGLKHHDFLKIKNLYFLTEFNWVRPYTYSQRSSRQSYAHNNQPLAHPLGANFWEISSILNYQWKRFNFDAKFVYAEFGLDVDSINWGKNIDLPFSKNRPFEYGNRVGQGLKTQQYFFNLKTAFLMNPKTNMRLELNLGYRDFKNDLSSENNLYFSFGFKTALSNVYKDFW